MSTLDSLIHPDDTSEVAEAKLLLFEERMRRESYVSYMEPCGDQVQFFEKWKPGVKTVILSGGNQAGKTRFGAWLATVFLLGKDYFRGAANWKWVESLPLPPTPTTVRAVGLDEKLLKDPIWETLRGRTYAEGSMFPPSQVKDVSTHEMTVRFRNDSRFHVRSASPTVDPKTHGGIKCDLVWIDEECGKPYYEENYQRTITKGGLLLVTATPLSDRAAPVIPWLQDLIQRAEDGDPEKVVIYLSVLNNPFIPAEEKRRLITKWKGHPEEMARLYGKPIHRSGLYYSMWERKPPIFVPATEIPSDAMRIVMIDPAATGPAAALWTAATQRGHLLHYREYKEKNRTVGQHVEAILAENRGDPIRMWVGDPFMLRQSVQQAQVKDTQMKVLQVWREAGLNRLIPAQSDYERCLTESREYLQAAFDETAPHPRAVIFDHLDKLANELDQYVIDSYAQGINRGLTRDKPRKGNDDLINCMQYTHGMGLRARATNPAQRPAAPGSHSYFATNTPAGGPPKMVWASPDPEPDPVQEAR